MPQNTIPMPHPLDVKEPPKPPEMMFACIERRNGITFCNRAPGREEFMFAPTAAQHVIDHYESRGRPKTPTPRLAGCNACIDNAKEILEKEGLSRLA